MEAVERHGHQHRANAVDGAKRPEQQSSPVFVNAGVHHQHVIDGLDDKAKHAAYHEYPEQIEEVQGDVAATGGIKAERAVFRLLPGFHVAQLAAKLALAGERRVKVGLHDDQEHRHHGMGDHVGSQAVEHDGADDDGGQDEYHGLGASCGMFAFVSQQADAEDGEHGGQCRVQHRFHHIDDHGGGGGFDVKVAGGECQHHGDDGDRQKHRGSSACHKAQHAEYLHRQGKAFAIDGVSVGSESFPYPGGGRCVRGRLSFVVSHNTPNEISRS